VKIKSWEDALVLVLVYVPVLATAAFMLLCGIAILALSIAAIATGAIK
jgi:hypothetical protein